MSRLLIKTEGLDVSEIELRLGTNRVGRDPEADFTLDHPSVSIKHCEFILSPEGLFVRDCDSTNGTYVNNQTIKVVRLAAGQSLRLGDVELLVESTDVTPGSQEKTPDKPAPSQGGQPLCRRHPQAAATFRCTQCGEELCPVCVHILRLQGGTAPLYLCPLCSHKCERIQPESGGEKKASTLDRTIVIPRFSWKDRIQQKKEPQ